VHYGGDYHRMVVRRNRGQPIYGALNGHLSSRGADCEYAAVDGADLRADHRADFRVRDFQVWLSELVFHRRVGADGGVDAVAVPVLAISERERRRGDGRDLHLLVCYIAGEHYFFSSAYTCLFLSCPLEAVPIINTVSSVGCMLGSLLQSYFFGFLADESGSFSYSMFMTEVLLVIGLAFSAIVFVIDLLRDGPLHKMAPLEGDFKAKAEEIGQTESLLQHDSKVRVYS